MVRCKNRYFAVEIEVIDRPGHVPLELKKAVLYQVIMKKVQEIYGDFGAAAVTNGFVAKYCNPYTKIALIRCRHGPHRYLGTILPLIRNLNQFSVRINVIYVGATILHCYKHIVRYHEKYLEKYWNKMKTDKDRMLLQDSVFNIEDINMN